MPYKKIIKNCLFCNKSFEIPRRWEKQKYCSRECSSMAQRKRQELTCLICGKEFSVPSCRKGTRFCSKKCMGIGFSGKNNPMYGVRRFGEDSPFWGKRKRVDCVCGECGKPFTVRPSEIKKGGGKHCTRKCAGIASRGTTHTKEVRQRMKEIATIRWQDLSFRKKMSKIFPKANEIKPNKLERFFDDMTPPNIRYIGNGTWWRLLPNGKRKNPDFKVTGENKVIEVYGDYFHRNDDPQELIGLFKQIGIDCLVIWEKEIYNQPQLVLEKVNDFILVN